MVARSVAGVSILPQTLEGRRENLRGLMIEIFAMHADLALMVVPRNLLVTTFFYPALIIAGFDPEQTSTLDARGGRKLANKYGL
jgi:hypothetical protein